MNAIDTKFVNAVKRMEKRTSRVGAYVVVDKCNVNRHGRVTISYPKDGAGRLFVIAWLPAMPANNDTFPSHRFAGWATGYGYDKATAAMGGARFLDVVQNREVTMRDQGWDWKHQLEDAGYLVLHGC